MTAPNPSKRRRLSPEERRTELLRTAMDVFADMGIARAGHGDIARVSGVSTATVFNYFPTREDLVRDVLIECELLFSNMIESLGENKNFAALAPREKMFGIARAYETLIERRPDVAKVYLNWSASFDPETRPGYLSFTDHVLETLMLLAPQALTTVDDARIVFGAANMITQMKLDGVEREVMERFIVRLAYVFLPDADRRA